MSDETYKYIQRLTDIQEKTTVADDDYYKALDAGIKALSESRQTNDVITLCNDYMKRLGVDYRDNVNHPSHYEGQCSMECIDVMTAVFGDENVGAFCLCNAFKYLWRYQAKNGEEDVKKAEWYLNHFDEINKTSTSFMPSLTDRASWLNRELEKAKARYGESEHTPVDSKG